MATRHRLEDWQKRLCASHEDIVVRIKADAPVLRPDEPVPGQSGL